MKAELDVFHRKGIHIDRKILRQARHPENRYGLVEFMEKFYVASIIEVMEGDFRTNYYLEFKEIPDPFDFNPAYRDSLEDIYFKASALYQKYRKKFQQRLVQLGWDTEGMDLAIEKARNYYIYWDQLVGMMYTNLWKVFQPPYPDRSWADST